MTENAATEKIREKQLEIAKVFEDQEHMKDQYDRLGSLGGVRIPEEKLQDIRNAITELNDIAKPTVKGLRSHEIQLELQDELYNLVYTEAEIYNQCMFKARNYKSANWCSDLFVNNLRGSVTADLKEILKKY